jgi:hypothetical protein
MEEPNSPYVFREEPDEPGDQDVVDGEVVIVDGQAMSLRSYRR